MASPHKLVPFKSPTRRAIELAIAYGLSFAAALIYRAALKKTGFEPFACLILVGCFAALEAISRKSRIGVRESDLMTPYNRNRRIKVEYLAGGKALYSLGWSLLITAMALAMVIILLGAIPPVSIFMMLVPIPFVGGLVMGAILAEVIESKY